MSLFDLSGKVAIITGSSRGIGRAIAEQLAIQGAKVVVSSRKIEACQEVVDAINAKHGSIWWTKPIASTARSTCWSATRHRTPTTAR